MKDKKILLANSLLVVALVLFISIPSIAIMLFRLHGSISGDTSLMLSGGTSVIALGGIALLYCRITKRSFNKVMLIKKISLKQVFLIMCVSGGTYIFAIGVNMISMRLFPIAIKDGMAISKLLNSSSTLLGLVVIVLVPAFFEEVFFRGIFLDAYEGINKKIKYFIITAIFATFHGNIMQIIYVMFLGFILLKVREYTGSLLGSMILHAVNNSISFILSKVVMIVSTGIDKGLIDSAQAAAATDTMNVSFIAVILKASIFLLIGGAILFINLRRLKEYKDGLELIEEEKDIEEKNIVKKEEIMYIDKKQYIPLVIYFVSMTVLVVLRY